MPRKQRASTEANEYINVDGVTASAFVGTEQDKVYISDPDWSPVGKHTPPPEKEGVAEATPHSGKTESEGRRPTTEEEAAETPAEVVLVDPKDHDRPELNKLAEEAGVEDPGEFPNKGAVAEAINAARTKAAETPAEEG